MEIGRLKRLNKAINEFELSLKPKKDEEVINRGVPLKFTEIVEHTYERPKGKLIAFFKDINTGKFRVLLFKKVFSGYTQYFENLGNIEVIENMPTGSITIISPFYKRKQIYKLLEDIVTEELLPYNHESNTILKEIEEDNDKEELERTIDKIKVIDIVPGKKSDIKKIKTSKVKYIKALSMEDKIMNLVDERGDNIDYIYNRPNNDVVDYNPEDKDPGESEEEYNRRIQIYNIYLNHDYDEIEADVASRMHNNIDYLGVDYEDKSMLL